MEQNLLEHYKKIRTDPWYFCTTCVFTLDATDKDNPIKKFPSHFEYLYLYVRLWQECRKIAVPKSRRMFMTWTNVSLYLWDTMFHQGKQNAIVSKKEDDSHDLIEKCKFIYDHIPEKVLPRQLLPRMDFKFCSIDFKEINSWIRGFPQGADQLRQYTLSGILADEIAFWSEAQATYAAAYPTLEGGGRFTALSSAAPGFFKRLVFDQLDQDIKE